MVPKLRFPEFRDAGEWEEFKLESIARYRRGSFPQPYGLPEWYDGDNGAPFIQVFDVSDDMRLKSNTKRKISDLAAEQSVFIEKGTVIITIQGSIGRVAVTQYDAYIDRTLLLFQEFLNPIEKLFFAYTIQMLFEIEKQKAPGGIIKTITKEALSSFVVRLPAIEEQQKIADCLSSLDELIAAHSKKFEALQSYKKGLMQNLFPAEGKTVPTLRFPEFEGAGEWEEKKLKDIAEFYKGKGISKADISPNGSQPCIRYGELYTVYGEVIDDVISRTDLSPDNMFVSNSGDVIIPSSGETKIDIATAACVVQGNIVLGGDLNVIRSEQNGIFLSYYLNGALKYEIAKVAQGDTVVHLYKHNLENLDLALPPLLEEQQKIADCLSSVDELITAQAQKIENLKAHKKGLMQQLFPATEGGG